MPAYPFLVRGLIELTGLSFATLAVVVSVVAAGGTALLFYRLMRHVLPEGSALFAVVLFCVAPAVAAAAGGVRRVDVPRSCSARASCCSSSGATWRCCPSCS